MNAAVTPEPPLNDTAVVYLTFVNDTADQVAVTGLSTDVAGDASLHETSIVDGVSQMRPVPRLTIAAGESVALTPGGVHIMLTDISQPLRVGDVFTLRLELDPNGSLETSVQVVDPSELLG